MKHFFLFFLSITIGYICIIKQIEYLVIKICEILWFDMSSYCRLGVLDDAYLSKKEQNWKGYNGMKDSEEQLVFH